MYKSFISLVVFVHLFEAFMDDIVSLISFSVFVLVCGKTTDFYVLILCPDTLLNVLISCRNSVEGLSYMESYCVHIRTL